MSLSDIEMRSQLPPSKIEEMVNKATSKIVDVKLQSENVVQELKSKIIGLQLVERGNENFMELCQILQNSIEYKNITI